MKRRRKSHLGLGLAVWGGFAALVLPAAAFMLANRSASLDAEGCVRGVEPQYSVTVFLDATDPYVSADVARMLDAEARRLPRRGRMQVWVLTQAQGPFIRPELSLCRPGDAGDANPMNENGARLEREFRKRVTERLADLSRKFSRGHADSSAIIDSLGQMTRQMPPAEHRRIVIVSDLLEFGPNANLYRGPVRFANVAPHLPADLRSNFQNMDVGVYLLPAKEPEQRIQRSPWFRAFWEDYFRSMNATDARFLPPPPAA